jgi:large subunit ribosomal protein L29
MDWQEIKNKGEKELSELLADQRAELQSLNFQAHNRQLKQVHKIQLVKKTIARISMLLTNIKRASSK